MVNVQDFIIQYWKQLIDATLAISTLVLGIKTYNKNNKIRALEEEKEFLKRDIHKISSKVDPESDCKLLVQAEKKVQIMGINSLGPLHHCREELIKFLEEKKGLLQIVLLNPQSDNFKKRELREKDSSLRLLTEWRASLGILKDIELRRTHGVIELRLRSDTPDRSLFIIDAINGLTDRTKMLINYYPTECGTRGYSGAQYLAEFVMERDRDSINRNNDYIQEVWKNSQPFYIDAAIELGRQVELTKRGMVGPSMPKKA